MYPAGYSSNGEVVVRSTIMYNGKPQDVTITARFDLTMGRGPAGNCDIRIIAVSPEEAYPTVLGGMEYHYDSIIRAVNVAANPCLKNTPANDQDWLSWRKYDV